MELQFDSLYELGFGAIAATKLQCNPNGITILLLPIQWNMHFVLVIHYE